MTVVWKRVSTLSTLLNESASNIYSANPSKTKFGQYLQSDILLHVLHMHVNRWHMYFISKTFMCPLKYSGNCALKVFNLKCEQVLYDSQNQWH